MVWFKKYPNDGLMYNTTIQVTDVDGQKVIDDIILINNFLFASIGEGVLQNGTTYILTVVASSYLGKSQPLVVNITIPRMGKRFYFQKIFSVFTNK
jgi:hypothetical protein